MRRSPLRSPPRVRGKVPVCCPEHRKVRITPAYAGKRRRRWASGSQDRDHPRVCGEKSANPKVRDTMEGASPRMRGKVFFFTGASFYAIFFLEPSGNLLLEPSGSSWVPPDGSIFVFAIGSPPRVRGKERTVPEQRSGNGITPACAGKSSASSSSVHRSRDHPRVCGEKRKTGAVPAPLPGSPPRMRGKGEEGLRRCLSERITPAYAGKSLTLTVLASLSWDHPRVCGEKDLTTERIHWFRGSPPRMRGKGGATSDIILHPGITPAYAGKSPLPPCRPVSPARFSGSGRHGPTLHPGRGCSHCPHKRRC